jgi:hypothetical protein
LLATVPFALALGAASGAFAADANGENPASEAPTAPHDSLSEVISLIDSGQFKLAGARIDRLLDASALPPTQRGALEFQRERMRRILLDFTRSETDVKAQLRESIPDLSEAEFAAWNRAGLLEHQDIDGRRLYFHLAASNLFRVSPEAVARRKNPPEWNDGPLEKPHPHHREVIAAARATGHTSVVPHRVRVTQAILVNKDIVPAGEIIRAWIPYPRSIKGQQEGIRLLETTPSKHLVAPEDTLQRTVYLEKPTVAGEGTSFSITYELSLFARYTAIDAAKVVATPALPELAPYMGERPPHIVFTKDMREFSRKVVDGERNPYRIAQKLFDAVDRTPWAGAREYSTISNIGDYALHAGHADCGQQTLLLMTLLRLNGIASRWQSGMIFSDGDYDNLHDWGWLYLAPYGWVPMDVTFGHLHDADPAVDDFYLGGLDAYRIAFNDDYSQPLTPAKQHFRSETVDLQRGEVEWRGGNLYFDQWDYSFEARVLHNEKSAGGKR